MAYCHVTVRLGEEEEEEDDDEEEEEREEGQFAKYRGVCPD